MCRPQNEDKETPVNKLFATSNFVNYVVLLLKKLITL